MTIYGYARCSTNETKQDISRQIRELKELGAEEKNIFFEYESGTKIDRIELNRLLETVETNDTIITTEVSRLARSSKQLIDILDFVQKKNIKLIIGSLVFDCRQEHETDIMTKAMLQMLGVFAELERNMISERVKSGMQNAKEKGKVIGRPKKTEADISDKYKEIRKLVLNKKINVTEACKILEISRKTYYKYNKIMEMEEE